MRGHRGHDRMVVGQLHVQPLIITTTVVSSNPANNEVYSITYYMIEFLCDLLQVGGFLGVLQFPSPINHDIAEILLKVALNSITLALYNGLDR